MVIDFDTKLIQGDLILKLGKRKPTILSLDSLISKSGAFLAGQFPGGITTVNGIPATATVRAIVRSNIENVDSTVIAEVQSGVDGTWRIDGLDPRLKYDVIGRKYGFNDVIMSNVTPTI